MARNAASPPSAIASSRMASRLRSRPRFELDGSTSTPSSVSSSCSPGSPPGDSGTSAGELAAPSSVRLTGPFSVCRVIGSTQSRSVPERRRPSTDRVADGSCALQGVRRPPRFPSRARRTRSKGRPSVSQTIAEQLLTDLIEQRADPSVRGPGVRSRPARSGRESHRRRAAGRDRRAHPSASIRTGTLATSARPIGIARVAGRPESRP